MNVRFLRPTLGLALTIILTFTASASSNKGIKGHVRDPLGANISNASVILLVDGKQVGQATSDASGAYEFDSLDGGRYTVRANAPGFNQAEIPVVVASGEILVNVTLPVGTLAQEIVVTASGIETPTSQVGASVSVVQQQDLQGKPELFEGLRLTPGIQAVESGSPGGKTSLFVRGGNSTSNKVLIDGVPANDIGGTYEFANLSSAAIGSTEVFRGPNSVLFGSDAISSVVNVTTRRGVTTTPQLILSAEGGTFGTAIYSADLAGAYKDFDYLTDISGYQTQNNIPNDAYHNTTFAGNYGWMPLSSTELRLTLRRNASSVGQPNAFDLYGIADDSQLKEQNTIIGGTLQNQTTARWHNLIRYGATRLTLQSVNPSPTGVPFDPFGFGPNYLGNTVKLCSPAGCTPPGQAILDFGGVYPSKFDSMTSRDFLQTQSDYRLNSHLTALFGFRYENERGDTHSSFSNSITQRDNFSYTIEGQGNLWSRLFATAGAGLEKNAIFGFAATPRVSLAYYAFRPSAGTLSGTKLKFNFGKGIKEPSIFDETSSLFSILSQSAPPLINQFHLAPSGPERSRSFDLGFEQSFDGDRVRLDATFFHNRFSDQIEFVDKTLLPGIGVPVAAANALPFGASVNSLAYRAMGLETGLEGNLGRGFAAKATYTYTDAVVQKSFSSDNQFPSFNPAFPTIPIGAFSPLVGARPFRIAPHVGTFSISYSRQKLFTSMTGYLTSRRDDSTFLTDSFFGSSLLLPNRNLADSYQKLDLHVSYKIHPAITAFGTAQNLLNQRYDAAYGFPSLPFTIRGGLRLTIGGEGWNLKP